MKNIYLALLLLIMSAVGCSQKEDNELKWHSTKQAAINAGLKEDDLSSESILDEVTQDGETFILYSMKLEEHNIVFIANVVEKDGKYAWYRSEAGTGVNNVSQVVGETSTYSKKKYKVYLGIAEELKGPITLDGGGSVMPTVKKGIYYYIEPITK
ncbi:hypothetical protein ACFFJY_17855 [Fictibacillus aquaticus]|uniref:Lipoprotein n=1 Tax=Fictibacillus aquaticus TaxID=2021314 RepID=A0A235F5T5_9BACL|nr:hypothetical protein [Fictibacillus aquaticus]OYD56592.1 hypothetical protein CGZ90_16400 [Fictibacillus aquaticus]